MKHYIISEIIYWVIAVISIFSFLKIGESIITEHIFFLVSPFFPYLWLYLEDILERNIQIRIK